MTRPIRSSDPTRRPGNSLIAAGLLAAVAAVLVGFHGTTMVLSAMSLSAQAPAEGKARWGQSDAPRVAHTNAQPVPAPARPAESSPPPAAVPAPPAEYGEAAPGAVPAAPTGVAAAAKAKALAEMEMEPDEAEAEEEPRRRPRRSYRAPRVDKHKVY